MDHKDKQDPQHSDSPSFHGPMLAPRSNGRYYGSHFSGLWLEIFLGVFLALMAHSIFGVLYVKWELRQIEKTMTQETLKLSEQLRRTR